MMKEDTGTKTNKMHDPRFIKSVTRTMNGLYMDLLQNSFIVLSRMGVLP